jgi:DNA polymerase-4
VSRAASVIAFAHVPCFYAEVERADDPELRGRAVIVGGDPRKRGSVLSASREALAVGVVEGMPVLEALERCPRARAIRTHMARYREVSGQLRAILRQEVDALEPMGLEAAFLDITGSSRAAEEIAGDLVRRVREQLAVPLRVGIAAAKFLAKLAAEEAGTADLRCIAVGEEARFLAPLSVERLPGVGPKTSATLARLGAKRVGELLGLDPATLESELGNHGLRILEYARGEEDSPVCAVRHAKSLSRESTFDEVQLDMGVLWERLQVLAQALETALLGEGLQARRVAVKIRYQDCDTTTRSRTLSRPVAQSAEIYRVGAKLLDRTHAGSRPIRLLGLTVSGLESSSAPQDQQLELFSDPGQP